MSLRGARILLAGACTEGGSSLAEAFLALGAHVVAADRLRTRLEELRARVRQHERLWVAECDLGAAEAAVALFTDVARDEPIDVALLVLAGSSLTTPAAARADAPARVLPELQHCRSFVDAALATMAQQARGRVLVLLEPGAAPAMAGAVAALVDAGAARAQACASALAVGGLVAPAALGSALPRLTALADPAQPALPRFELGG